MIAAAISRRVAITGEHSLDNKIVLHLPDIDGEESFDLLPHYEYTRQREYYKSAFNVLYKKGLTFSSGIEGTVRGNIPINSGTSSSSALLVAWIHFLIQLSDQKPFVPNKDIAQWAYEAEILEFGEPGGMMDQFSTAVGNVIYLASQPVIHIETLKPTFGAFVLGDSQEPKDTIGILGRLKGGVNQIIQKIKTVQPDYSLHTTTLTATHEFKDFLSKGEMILLRGTLSNRDILVEAKQALSAEILDHQYFGKLLSTHHQNLRDAQQISTPKIERMITAALEAGALGAKINGSGGGGCMFAYAPNDPEKVADAIESEGGKSYIIRVDEGTKVENN